MTGHEWIGALDALISGRMVKPRAGGHPRAFIWGALEARLQHVDTLLMGGLNEGVWPQAGQEDPFLSRSMKAAIGLEPPERRIGQAAHDFQMAMGAPEVVLSRSHRSGKAPTVASRWLQRLLAVIGPQPAAMLRSRGAALLAHVRTLDQGPSTPTHPARSRVRRKSCSRNPIPSRRLATLRRDPYAIYARRILAPRSAGAFSRRSRSARARYALPRNPRGSSFRNRARFTHTRQPCARLPPRIFAMRLARCHRAGLADAL
jgi:ATP-dependent helicase/nuclease subunit B